MCQVVHIDTCCVCGRVEAYMECLLTRIFVCILWLPFGYEHFSVLEHVIEMLS